MTDTPNSAAEPSDLLLHLLRKGGTISKMSETPIASTGLPYCYVEITETTGTQYIIDAYGQKALKLYDNAIKIMNARVSRP